MQSDTLTITIRANSASAIKSLQAVSGGIGSLDRASAKASKGFNTIQAAAVAVGTIAGKVITSAFQKISSSVDSAIRRVDTMNNFPKVMSNLGITAEDSSAAIKRMADRLKGLPTALDSMAASVQRIAATTGDVHAATDIMLAFNNAVLAGGMSAEVQSSAIEQFSQAFGKGKPDMIEWRSILNAMPAQMKQLATALKYPNVEALGEALRLGELSMQDFSSAIVKLDKQGGDGIVSFHKQAIDATGGIQTGWTNAQTAITRGVATVITAFGASNISSSIADIGDKFEFALSKVADFITYLRNNSETVRIFAAVITGLGTALAAMSAPTIAANISKIGATIAKNFTSITKIFTGNPIVSIILGIVTALAVFLTQTETGKKLLSELGKFFSFLGDGIGEIAKGVLPIFQNIFEKVAEVFSEIAGKIGPVIASVFQKIGSVISSIMPFIAELITEFGEIIEEIFPALMPLIESVIQLFVQLGESVVTIAVSIFNAVKPIIPLLAKIVGAVVLLASEIAKALIPIVTAIIKLIVEIMPILMPIITMIVEAIGSIIEALMPIIEIVLGIIAAIIPPILGVITVIAQVVAKIIEIITPIVLFIINLVMGIITAIINIITSVVGFITGVIQTIINIVGGIVGAVSGVLSNVVSFFTTAFSAISNFVEGVVGNIIGFFQSIPGKIGAVVEKVVGFFSGIGKKIGEFIGGAIKGVVNGALGLLEGFLNTPINIINGALGLINLLPGVDIPMIPKIQLPRMEEGGVLGGSSYVGDRQMFMGNTGEMVINRRDQAALFDAIKSGDFGGGGIVIEEGAVQVEYRATGEGGEIDAKNIGKEILRQLISQGLKPDLSNVAALR